MNQGSAFTIRRALEEGWRGTTRHFWFVVGVAVIFYVLSAIPGLVEMMVPNDREDGFFWVIYVVVSLGSWLLQSIMSMGLIKIALNILAGQPVEYRQLFSEHRKLFTFVAASFLYGVIVMVGVVLFIIPGIYWALKYQFFAYYIVEANDGVFDALRKSGEITRGAILKLLAFSCLNVAIGLLGVLFFGIGLLVAMPITMIATASVYRQLSARFTPAAGEARPTGRPAPPPAAPVPAATPAAG